MNFEQKLKDDNIKTLVKSLSAMEDVSLTKLKVLINHKYNKEDTLDNLMKKLRIKTIRVSELLEILDVLGYDLIVRKR